MPQATFVHERHGRELSTPRFAGWWGNEPETRFKMQEIDEFTPRVGADGWQLSNPPILAAAPLVSSLELFDEVGMDALVEKSRKLTGYLEYLLDERLTKDCTIVTPRDPAQRGCQLSVRVHDRPRARFDRLRPAGITCDFRHPDVIRLAPVPLYNTFTDAHETARILGET